MNNIEIVYLADRPDYIEACASWAYGQWGTQKSDGSLDRGLSRFGHGAQKDAVPLTLVAVSNGFPAGMVSIWESNFDGAPELTPWLASLYVHPFHRGKGIALQLVAAIEGEARRLGFEEIYLVTEEAGELYKQANWTVQKNVVTDFGPALLMSKQIL